MEDAITKPVSVLLFVKAPVPGRCKTRLARHVGNVHAARCHRAMTEHVVRHLAGLPDVRLTLMCAPDTRHAFFRRLARRYRCRLERQHRGTLGQRMHHALRQAIRRQEPALVMGSDQPDLADLPLAGVRQALDADRAVLAPTHDGGYWFIALPQTQARLFWGISWSTPRVARQTRTGFRRLRMSWTESTPRRDVDTHADWRALPRRTRLALGRAVVMPGRAAARGAAPDDEPR
ncbi:TIGR04282 family arsenosugar biosynthesis glycosyltransferase [Salinisphaera sp. Q1T1-3]|uniref:TIGR04282 family arsenosugar biosynthesis glycosyltransferase n=1 Tax=Salinisphaera sp. Q1T1-3 TaxID=2321229 RepID=UPI000E76BF70|nr:TIGR04282 family arsenosugar biosynthesis glycosyltransferase [Salinisphaera sp. Q1T1-3]RJS93108.1 glycosyltransferase [Salinisphaera sp. Q1T1-3]